METYKTETNWMRDYVLPAFRFHFSEIAENYRRNCEETAYELERIARRVDLRKAGVFESLRNLVAIRTDSDNIWRDLRKSVEDAETKRNQDLSNRIKETEIYILPPTDNHRPRAAA